MGDRATEPRVAPQTWNPKSITEKELNLKEIKPKPEAKPILRSLRDGIENLKKTASRERSQTRQTGSSGGGFLEKISRLTQGNRSRNPAKKSASFTFAVRPEVAMRSGEKYASLEPDMNSSNVNTRGVKQPVQRSVSAGVLETRQDSVELEPNYARVRDSLVLSSSPSNLAKAKAEDIYAEICESAAAEYRPEDFSENRIVAKVKIVVKNDADCNIRVQEERFGHNNYVNLIHTSQQIDSIINTDIDVVYNTVF